MTRVTQLAQQTQTLSNILDAQKRIQKANAQASSGLKSQAYTGIAQKSKHLVSLEALRIRADQLDKNNTIIEARLQRMENSISTIFTAVTELRNKLMQRISNAGGSSVQLAAIANNLLNVVGGQLNAKENGRFLFSGTQTNAAAVSIPVPDPEVFGVPEAKYYKGNSTVLKVRIDDTITISYGMTADRPAFKDTIAALKAAIQGDTANNNTLLKTALNLTNSALSALAGYLTEIGSDTSTIAQAKQRNKDYNLFVERSISDIVNVDVPSAILRLTAHQTILEASFLSLSRIRSLSLVKYLR